MDFHQLIGLAGEANRRAVHLGLAFQRISQAVADLSAGNLVFQMENSAAGFAAGFVQANAHFRSFHPDGGDHRRFGFQRYQLFFRREGPGVNAVALVLHAVAEGSRFVFGHGGMVCAGGQADGKLVDSPFRVGIRAGGTIEQRQAQRGTLATVAVLAVAHHHQALALLPNRQAVLQAGNVVSRALPADGTGCGIIAETAGLITQRRLEGEHRNGSSADLMPVRKRLLLRCFL